MGTSFSKSDWEAAIQTKRARLPSADADERFTLYCEIGDIYCDELQQRSEAINAYLEAQALQPESFGELRYTRLSDLIARTQEWGLAIELMMRLAAREKVCRRRGRSYYTAGVIYRDALKSNDEAIGQFNRALDAYFESQEHISEQDFSVYLNPFRAIEKIYITGNDWKALAHSCHKMIDRLPKVGQELVAAALWQSLEEIYRSRLGDIPSATHARGVAVQLEPDNRKRREMLAKLGLASVPTPSTAVVQPASAAVEHLGPTPWTAGLTAEPIQVGDNES
jgi:tetratricopeptide (TPR) repeat protein